MAVKMSEEKSIKASALNHQFFNIASIPLRDAWSDFVLSRQAMQVTQRTLKNYQFILGKFINWLESQGITKPEEVSARFVRNYLALFSGKSDWYVNDQARAIRTLLRFWYKEGYLPAPVTFDMPKVHQKRLLFLNAEQVQKLVSVCNVKELAIVLLMVDSGLRRQEVINLDIKDVDIKSGLVVVRQGKGRKDRISAIGATTRRAILKYLPTLQNQDKNMPLFQTKDGGRYTAAGFRSLFVRLSKKAGFNVTPHALRRSFATLSLQSGLDIVSLQTLMGHSNIETTRRYIQWLDSDILEAHHLHSPVDNLPKR
jgi:integrase/recombinase XerD